MPIQQPTGNPPVKSTTINEQSVAETPAPLEPPVAETPAPTPGLFAGYTHYSTDQIPGNIIHLLGRVTGVLLTIGTVLLSTWRLLSGEVWAHTV